MNIKLDLDFATQCFVDLAQSKGMDTKTFQEEFLMFFEPTTEQEDFNRGYENLIKNFKLLEMAFQQKDLMTMNIALLFMRSTRLDTYFYNITNGCYKVLKYDSRFQWPEIPQDYNLADYEHYDIHLRPQLLTHPERLDKFQTLMLEIAEYFGVDPNELKYGCKPGLQTAAWNLDYTLSLHDRITIDSTNMLQAFLLHHLAMKENDLVTAQVGLMHAAVCATHVEQTINNLINDCDKMGIFDTRFEWPKLDNSPIPDHYQYDGYEVKKFKLPETS